MRILERTWVGLNMELVRIWHRSMVLKVFKEDFLWKITNVVWNWSGCRKYLGLNWYRLETLSWMGLVGSWDRSCLDLGFRNQIKDKKKRWIVVSKHPKWMCCLELDQMLILIHLMHVLMEYNPHQYIHWPICQLWNHWNILGKETGILRNNFDWIVFATGKNLA